MSIFKFAQPAAAKATSALSTKLVMIVLQAKVCLSGVYAQQWHGFFELDELGRRRCMI
jgi:hypothetical protein